MDKDAHSLELSKINKLIKTLEEELTSKADKIKAQESAIYEESVLRRKLELRIRDLEKTYDPAKKETVKFNMK